MKLSVVIMVKNEIDVIRDCCGHLSALFDDVVVIDHRSSDGTREYLDEVSKINSKFHVFYLNEPGYYQSLLMTWIVKNIDVCNQADWVFLLDADEVLPFYNREEFEGALIGYKSEPIISMSWKNLIPLNYSTNAIFGKSYLEPKSVARHHKIAYQPSLIPVSDFIIAQGNHAILAGMPGKELPSTSSFILYHVPVRSKEQIEFKVTQGAKAYAAMGEQRNKALGAHWFDISEYIQKHGVSDDFLNGLALNYGENIEVNETNIKYEKLLGLGGNEVTLDFAYDVLPEVGQTLAGIEKSINASSESHGCEVKCEDDVTIKLNSNNEILFMENKNTQFYSRLSDQDKYNKDCNDLEFLMEFMKSATWKIESFTPTSWGGHIPFLFCLISLMRPRIYAELGSHFGASFFAACQAIKVNKIDATAVAIDLWEGDEHAGFYGESVYKNFKHILNKRYSAVGNHLRMSFDEASAMFEDQSIDLLHIDGLHTYEAVKNDYETWRSKLTTNGVIIFHDTNVFEREFGVWQLWNEIKSDGVCFEFKHTHGLGVMAFGSVDESPVVRLLTMVNNSQVLSDNFESFFGRVGELTNQEAIVDINRGAADSSSSFGILRNKLRSLKIALRNRIVHFIKSVPVLRKLAYSALRFIRR